MGKRGSKEDEDYIRKKIRKWQGKLVGKELEAEPSLVPTMSPMCDEIDTDELPEEYLIALGSEGKDGNITGEAVREELALQWSQIISHGLGKEAKEKILDKYPLPSNFARAVAPKLNPELMAAASNITIKRDKRISLRQNTIGKMMTCLGKSLTSLLRGNINSKVLIEEINDAAKLAAEVFHEDSNSRKFFALAGANSIVRDAVRNSPADEFLFGSDCAEKIKAAQAIQKTGSQIKLDATLAPRSKSTSTVAKKQENWKGPSQTPQYYSQYRGRGGRHRQPMKRNTNYNHTRIQKRQPNGSRNKYHR